MPKIRSQLLPIQMTTFLEIILYLHECCHSSLNDYEKSILLKFAISLAENMETNPEGPITISLYSGTLGVNTGSHGRKRITAVKTALSYLMRGVKAPSSLEHWKYSPRRS